MTVESLQELQLERLRGAPAIVLWLVQDMGCWVVGSRAGFTVDRVHAGSDWDILVPPHQWQGLIGALPLDDARPTRRGGWRFTPSRGGVVGPTVDVFPCDLGDWLTKALTHVAWHPKTGTILQKLSAP